jgi:hypothetical protein
MENVANFNTPIVNIHYNIPWTTVAGGIMGYALWQKIGQLAAKRIPQIEPVIPLLVVMGGLIGLSLPPRSCSSASGCAGNSSHCGDAASKGPEERDSSFFFNRHDKRSSRGA